MGSPSSRSTPDRGASSPATSRSKVDLPQPDGPSNATNSPGLTLKLTSSSTGKTLPSMSKAWLMRSTSSDGSDSRISDRFSKGMRYHLTTPFCQISRRSRVRNSSVIAPEHSSDITISAAYMLA